MSSSERASASSDAQRPRIVSGGEAAEFDRWQRPTVGTAPDGLRGRTLKDLEALQQEAWDEAFAQGYAEGREQGSADTRAEVQRFAALIEQLAQPFAELDDCVEQQVLHLTMLVARKLIRRELQTEPSHVIGVVRDALAVLPVAAREVRVELHPDDAELVRRMLKPVEGERAWSVIENPLLTRGGCRVATATSRIDASVEARLATITAALVGDRRDTHRSDSSGDESGATDAADGTSNT